MIKNKTIFLGKIFYWDYFPKESEILTEGEPIFLATITCFNEKDNSFFEWHYLSEFSKEETIYLSVKSFPFKEGIKNISISPYQNTESKF